MLRTSDILPPLLLHSGGYHCEPCGRDYKHGKSFRTHRRLAHSALFITRCPKCPFTTVFPTSLIRHHALRHLRRRSGYIPRRAISSEKKKKAKDFWQSSNASSPEKRSYIERNFKLTPNTQSRLFRKINNPVKKSLKFRDKGAGRKMDEFWARIEQPLLDKFKFRRSLGCIVHRRHLANWVYLICAELGMNLAEEAEKQKWKSPPKVIRQHIARFCGRNKIFMKPASRQLHKAPEVGLIQYLFLFIRKKISINENINII